MSTTRASIRLERDIDKGAFLGSIGLFRLGPLVSERWRSLSSCTPEACDEYLSPVRREFENVVALGPLPGDDDLYEAKARSYVEALDQLAESPTGEEASAVPTTLSRLALSALLRTRAGSGRGPCRFVFQNSGSIPPGGLCCDR